MAGVWIHYTGVHRTLREEIANSITHGFGIALAIAGLVFLVIYSAATGDPWKIVSCSIYGATLVILYTSSTLYHSFQQPRLKRRLQILDHACIYLLIAGTYTPFTLVTLRGPWGWSLFGVIWALALCGLVFKLLFIDRFKVLSVVVYLIMGWLAVIAIKPMMERMSFSSLVWIAAGGLLYTVGVLFYVAERRWRYSHAVWHVFVLGGSACHFVAVVLCVLLTAAHTP